MSDPETLKRQLAELKTEHRDLDDAIEALRKAAVYDNIQMQRIKKRKLLLKDAIARIESMLVPDIIA
ncbi:MAG: DUF465 domain-containing protein [Alphaproteobacteria bacterium]|nr:DUF465 domain-containing protein [Alphaproteobacteria bacterium]